MSRFLAWLWGTERGAANMLRLPFSALSVLYGAVSGARVFLYQKGWLPKKRVSCRVVSIGNITAGGTGKTPMTIYFAEELQKRGHKVGIVSRGYRRSNKREVVVVSEGGQPLAPPEAAGDEPYLMAERLRGVPIVVSADRFKGCETLIKRFGVNVILLDDGFQHLKLHRDLNILVIDAMNPFGNGHLLPRGCLREPLSEMARADCVIFTRAEDGRSMEDIVQQVRPFQGRMLHTRFEATHWLDLKTGELHAPSALAGMRVTPFCGIGNPDAFLKQLKVLGLKMEPPFIFKDHHPYQEKNLLAMASAARQHGAAALVTTEKDAVKIRDFMPKDVQVFALRITLVFKEGSEDLLSSFFER